LGTRAHTVPKFYLDGFTASESTEHVSPFLWIGSLTTGVIFQRSPKNFSIVRGLYDGQGGLSGPNESIEAHLANIESSASIAIRRFTATKGVPIAPEISRFLAWQAARTPGWIKLVQQWVDEFSSDSHHEIVEPPPSGFENIDNRMRPLCLEDSKTGARQEVIDEEEFNALRKKGWKWVLRRDDHLEALHIQAWYFQVRHFPRLSWVRLDAPDGEFFITSDRSVAWLADGYADTLPAALRNPTAQVVAPLTKKVALVGRHGTDRLDVTPREINRRIAFLASEWIAGPTSDIIQQAMADRQQLHQ